EVDDFVDALCHGLLLLSMAAGHPSTWSVSMCSWLATPPEDWRREQTVLAMKRPPRRSAAARVRTSPASGGRRLGEARLAHQRSVDVDVVEEGPSRGVRARILAVVEDDGDADDGAGRRRDRWGCERTVRQVRGLP